MLLTRNSIIVVTLILLNLAVSKQRLSGQDVTILDTLDYIPMYTEGALDYNLMIASSKGLRTEINRLISKGAHIDAETYEGATPLIFAVANNRLTSVEALLAWNPNVDKKTAGHETALLIAVKNMNTEIAETLIRGGANIDLSDNHGVTPLHYAAVNGDMMMTDLLLYYDADCNLKSEDGTTPLMASILSGHADVTDLLFQNGANLEARDQEGFTPFLIAAQNGDTAIMNLLLKEGVDLYEKNIHNYNALALAIQSNQVPAAELLLKKGDLWNEQEKGGVNPYTVAAAFGRKEITLLLEKYNIKGKQGFRMDVISLSASTRVNSRDFLAGMMLSFKEPLLDAGFMAGFDTKPSRTRVIKEVGANEYYQYLDKSSLVYAGLFKDFRLVEKPSGLTIMASVSLSAGYNFGPAFNGTVARPESKARIMPAAGIKFVRSNLALSAGIEYLKTEFYKTGPLWGRLSFTYSYRLSGVKKHEKTIEW